MQKIQKCSLEFKKLNSDSIFEKKSAPAYLLKARDLKRIICVY